MRELPVLKASPFIERQDTGDTLVIRRATPDDLGLVVQMDSTDEFMSRQPVGAEKRLGGKIASGDVFLAFGGSLPLGYARFDVLWPEMVPLLAWMWVDPAYRRSGIAAELRRHTFSEMKKDGFTSILRSACTERPEMIARIRRECGAEAGRLRYENGVEEIFFWQPLDNY